MIPTRLGQALQQTICSSSYEASLQVPAFSRTSIRTPGLHAPPVYYTRNRDAISQHMQAKPQ